MLLVFLVIAAGAVARVKNLFAAAFLSGFFSLLCASYYTIVDAVDVAFTEAAVGAGLSTVIMLSALALTTSDETRARNHNVFAALVCCAVAAMLLFGTLDMPEYGKQDAPINRSDRPAGYYMAHSFEDTGIPNVVTSVLASYRGYDTLGETTVIFTAGVAVMLLLGRRRHKQPHAA